MWNLPYTHPTCAALPLTSHHQTLEPMLTRQTTMKHPKSTREKSDRGRALRVLRDTLSHYNGFFVKSVCQRATLQAGEMVASTLRLGVCTRGLCSGDCVRSNIPDSEPHPLTSREGRNRTIRQSNHRMRRLELSSREEPRWDSQNVDLSIL